jgi:predicted RNase H-like HicB family nuclease
VHLFAVVTQGATLDDTVANLSEAVELHLEDAELDTGTLRAIIRQASRYVAMDELHERFFR